MLVFVARRAPVPKLRRGHQPPHWPTPGCGLTVESPPPRNQPQKPAKFFRLPSGTTGDPRSHLEAALLWRKPEGAEASGKAPLMAPGAQERSQTSKMSSREMALAVNSPGGQVGLANATARDTCNMFRAASDQEVTRLFLMTPYVRVFKWLSD